MKKLLVAVALSATLGGCVSHTTTVYRPAPVVWAEYPVYHPAPPVRPYYRHCWRCW